MKLPQINIIGAGAAGLYLAGFLAHHRLAINFFDLGKKPGRKILIAGGGFCNFTNQEVSKANYLSSNPHFAISALAGHSNWDIIAQISQAGIDYTIKENSKYFTTQGSKEIVNWLLQRIDSAAVYSRAQVNWHWQTAITDIQANTTAHESESNSINQELEVQNATAPLRLITQQGEEVLGDIAIIATGGLAYGRLQVSDLVKNFSFVEQDKQGWIATQPGLVPLAYNSESSFYRQLSGCCVYVNITNQERSQSFSHNLLFTHQGISGPAVLQISNYWQAGQAVYIDFLPRVDLEHILKTTRQQGKFTFTQQVMSAIKDYNDDSQSNTLSHQITAKAQVKSLLTKLLPTSLVDLWENLQADSRKTTYIVKQIQPLLTLQIAQLTQEQIQTLTDFLKNYEFIATQDCGYDKAEVMRGGINTDLLSSRTMAFKAWPQVYSIGEVVDVTGQLGGFNFQWCWASAYAAYKGICAQLGLTPVTIADLLE
ncbi:BaiN/RdsA family NAD(P)/FAD-dependent oxidoreductase [Psittacicella hinzii]|uniref:Uncharacterized protein n=1 Tax=Psittacicella hinzii TaxID=2028575 RepID=A0A3A1YGQ3_9GAMM|nr:NAD(P)/FAD-dependent oxidoreductase [Psittacicella hinzii]RIY36781.1 hypothetical protein CKF58_05635 [Psittacicella hinzii]